MTSATPDPTPATRPPDDAWERARVHCGWITPTVARKHMEAMLARGQQAEAERDELMTIARLAQTSVEDIGIDGKGDEYRLWIAQPTPAQETLINALCVLPADLRAALAAPQEGQR
jgi:hypothetical protein